MKVLHCADIHYRNDLVDEINKCTDFMVNKAKEEEVDLSIIAGDLFDERQTYDSAAFRSAIDFVKKLSEVSPVYILKGTNSHDGSSIKFLEFINTKHPVYVAEEIGHVCFQNDFKVIEYEALTDELRKEASITGLCTKALIFGIPPVTKANMLAFNGNDMEGSRQDTIEALRNVIQMFGTLSEEAHNAGIPVILVGHLTVTGSTLSTGQQMVGREVELGVGDLRMTGADLVCLGHIHKVQSWKEIFYSGSITRLNFGEEEDKGFWIHEFYKSELEESRFIKTPARQMVTIELNDESAETVMNNLSEGSYVRVRYQTTEEDVHKIDEKELKEKLLNIGAADVKIEKTVIPTERVRAEGISRLNSLDEKLRKWGETSGTEISDGVFEKLQSLGEKLNTEEGELQKIA
jgi:exonuclease SbcD